MAVSTPPRWTTSTHGSCPTRGPRGPALAARYRSLADADPATLGRRLLRFYDATASASRASPTPPTRSSPPPMTARTCCRATTRHPRRAARLDVHRPHAPVVPHGGHILPSSTAGTSASSSTPGRSYRAPSTRPSSGWHGTAASHGHRHLLRSIRLLATRADELEGLRDLSGVVALDLRSPPAPTPSAGVDYARSPEAPGRAGHGASGPCASRSAAATARPATPPR